MYKRPPSPAARRAQEILAERQYEATHGVSTTTGTFAGVCEILAAKGYDLTKGSTSGDVTLYPHPKKKKVFATIRRVK